MKPDAFDVKHGTDRLYTAQWPGGHSCLGRLLLLFVLFAALPSDAQEDRGAPLTNVSGALRSKSEIFLSAQSAYDAERYDDAALLYGRLITNGVNNVEVHYNLGNAMFKGGNLPGAVLHYRRAWYDAPRDPDIRANLHFALSAAGAVDPSSSLMDRLFTACSLEEWIMIGTVSYIMTALLLISGLIFRPARRITFRSALLTVLIALLSAGGWWHWRQMRIHPEWVVVQSGATALFAPVDGATAHYPLPLAALVQQQTTDSKGWIEIIYDGKKGWVKRSYIQRVYP